jgi:hemolysin D
MLPHKDIRFVNEGHKASVKIHTFLFTKYGLIDGRVKTLSNDAIEDENLGLVFSHCCPVNFSK